MEGHSEGVGLRKDMAQDVGSKKTGNNRTVSLGNNH